MAQRSMVRLRDRLGEQRSSSKYSEAERDGYCLGLSIRFRFEFATEVIRTVTVGGTHGNVLSGRARERTS